MRDIAEKFELLDGLVHPFDEMRAIVGDVELVHAARGGDAAAMGALLERHRAGAYASALSILGHRELAQDAVQDAYLIALRRIDDLRDPAAFAGWLHAIVRNACLMRLRRHAEELPGELPNDPQTPSDAEQELERVALNSWVWTALEQLPTELRVAVMLRYFTHHATAYTEIAATLGIPVGTVRSRLNQAKAQLADALLRAASAAHIDNGRLVEQRRLEWDAIAHEIYTTGAAALYVADCAADVMVEAPSMGYRVRGADDQRRGAEESAAAGVRLNLTGVVASPQVTIYEGTYENPPDQPHHCPATHTEVRIHPDGPTTRLILYYPPAVAHSAPAEAA